MTKVEDLVGPYPSGRVYLRDERQVGSFIRGKPRNALAVKCMFHAKCTWVLPLHMAPTDDDLKAWLVAVPQSEASDSLLEKTRKRDEHLALALKFRTPASVVPVPPTGVAPPAAVTGASSSGG